MKEKGVTRLYRFSRVCYERKIFLLPKIIKNFIRVVFSATIPYKSKIGYGTKFPHGGQGVVINEKAIIGNNCIISAGTVIGGKKGKDGAPTIGDNCTLGANCCVIGDIFIGDNSVIGAGAVVVKNVPPNSVVVGNPAKVIKTVNKSKGCSENE